MISLEQVVGGLQQRVAQACAQGERLQIVGAGSKAFYVRQHSGSVLDARALCGVVAYEPSELVVTVAAGTPLAELEALLAQHGQYLPFEPPAFGGGGTVGGMVATALAGPARASVGGVRDYVLGMKLINGQGQALQFGGQVMKNVAGYDVSRLMVGALGTLGLITEVSLKVLPQPVAEATLRFALDQAAALEHLHRWGGQPLPLNASSWEPGADGAGCLWLRLRGAAAAVQTATERLLAQAGGETVDTATARAHWDGCRHHTHAFFQAAGPGRPAAAPQLWRLSLPQTAPVLSDYPAVWVEWHGAQRWVWADAADSAGGAALRAAAGAVGGSANPFRLAPGVAGAPLRMAAPQPALQAVYGRLKAAFDPKGVFNADLSPDENQSGS